MSPLSTILLILIRLLVLRHQDTLAYKRFYFVIAFIMKHDNVLFMKM